MENKTKKKFHKDYGENDRSCKTTGTYHDSGSVSWNLRVSVCHFPDDHSRTRCTSCYERAACDKISDHFGFPCSNAWNPPLCRTVL